MSDGRTIGTLVGGVLGFVTGGVGYVAIGAALGGFAGGLLDPASSSTEPQRLDDLKVSVSQYGAGIPEVRGNEVPPATWIWTTDIQEVPQYYSPGKGGGEEGPSSYFYMIHGLVCLGRSPSNGESVHLRKLYKDGKLVWDVSSGLSVAQALASAENPFVGLQLLDGREDQAPIAFMELWEGAGNAPAFRGLITLLIVGLETPGGRVPQISAEVCVGAAVEPVLEEYNSVETDVNYTGIMTASSIFHVPSIRQGGENYRASYEVTPDSVTAVVASRAPFASELNYQSFLPAIGALEEPRSVESHYAFDDDSQIVYTAMKHRSGDPEEIYHGPYSFDGRGLIQYAVYDEVNEWYALKVKNDSTLLVMPANQYSPEITGTIFSRCMYAGVLTTAYSTTPGQIRLLQYNFDGEAGWTFIKDQLLGTFANDAEALVLETGKGLFVQVVEAGDDKVSFYRINRQGVERLSIYEADLWPAPQQSTFFCNELYALIGPFYEDGRAEYKMIRHSVLIPNEASVAEIISDQVLRSGLDEAQVDTSTVPDTVWGYAFNKSPASARNNIAPLLTYAGIVVVEEDGLIRFVRRADIEPGELIPWADLACTEEGQEQGDPFPLVRANEGECPRSMTVSYVNPGFDYQVSTETVRRQTVDSEFDEQVDLAVAMSADKAASIAHRLLYERYVARNARSSKLSRKYAFISPGDVHPVEYRPGTIGNFMAAKVTDTGALIEIEWIEADAELLTQTVPGAGGYQPQEISPLAPSTILTLGDMPILRDSDDDAGLYAFLTGSGGAYPGGQLYVGDDRNDLAPRGSVRMSAIRGLAQTKLGNWTSGTVDESNLLTVNVGSGELSGITYDALLNGKQNVAAIGNSGRWEIVKFQRADDLGGGNFILSGFVRGLRGTEWARGTHTAADLFVLLGMAGTLRVALDAGSIRQSKIYKAVTLGRRFDSAATQSYANTAEGLRPFSPTTPRLAKSGDDAVFSWGRRTRLSTTWWLGNVPLGEDSERWEVDVLDAGFGAVKRTLTSFTSSVIYTAAQQIADFGSVQSTFFLHVYQISGQVGRGHPLEIQL